MSATKKETKKPLDDKLFREVCIEDKLAALVQQLHSEDMAEVEEAVVEMWKRSVNASAKVKFARAGAIPPLVALLSNGTADAKEKAAGALLNLAGNAENKIAIASAGGIPPLVALLSNGTAIAKEKASSAER